MNTAFADTNRAAHGRPSFFFHSNAIVDDASKSHSATTNRWFYAPRFAQVIAAFTRCRPAYRRLR
jgi:hypothetical protein